VYKLVIFFFAVARYVTLCHVDSQFNEFGLVVLDSVNTNSQMVKIYQGEIVAADDPRLKRAPAPATQTAPSQSSSTYSHAAPADASDDKILGLPPISFRGHVIKPQHYLAVGLLVMILGLPGLLVAALLYFFFVRPQATASAGTGTSTGSVHLRSSTPSNQPRKRTGIVDIHDK
jgi:hypothetical protein